MSTAATILRDLGFLLYGGPLVAFTILVLFAGRLTGDRPWRLVRTYQAWGPGLGVSLGVTVLGALTMHWLEHGAFRWTWATPAEAWSTAAWVAFFLVWVSNLRLEVWTLEPLRKLDRDGVVSDEDAYRKRLGPVQAHMIGHSLMVVVVLVLKTIAENL